MKILHVTNLGFVNGGVETGLLLLKPELERRGHVVKIFTSDERPDLPHFGDYEFPAMERSSTLMRILYRTFYPTAYFALRKVLKEFAPDVVHLHTISQMSPSVLFALRGQSVVATVHQTEDYLSSILTWSFPESYFTDGSHNASRLTFEGKLHYFYHRWINGKVYRLGFRFVKRFIAVSKYMQGILKVEGIKSVHIPNATALFDCSPVRSGEKVLAYVGRLEQTKGLEYLLRAIPLIKQTFPEVKLLIAGRGEYEKQLRVLVDELGITENVEILGYLNRDGVREVYERSTIIIMPSVWPESFGLVGIEAMSVGRPMIATSVGGVTDWLIDGKTGYLVPPQDADGIAEKVIALFRDPSLIARMSQEARAHAESFTITRHVDRLLQVYEEIRSK